MSNNKQSSVEWLALQLTAKMQMWNSTKNYQEFHIVLEAGEFANLIEQAKAMHETEHFNTWWHEISENEPISFQQYYNETFNTNENNNRI